ncbi:hypothetical protein FHS19_001652 [Paenibacillus rhizosphaerae]|uniref:Uncharacterized protein n=1 Tax=Paenibacillus rhizosphaerae TaxID=297318 RepID=A0A839TNJ9_9BACL|nr:hypothetical protein [Paenibacillus rhizosphaerae]
MQTIRQPVLEQAELLFQPAGVAEKMKPNTVLESSK